MDPMNNIIPSKVGWPVDKEKEREKERAAAATASRHRRVPDSPLPSSTSLEQPGSLGNHTTSPPPPPVSHANAERGSQAQERTTPKKDAGSSRPQGSKPTPTDDLESLAASFRSGPSSTWADQVEEETPEEVGFAFSDFSRF